jgi:hypothetical protein
MKEFSRRAYNVMVALENATTTIHPLDRITKLIGLARLLIYCSFLTFYSRDSVFDVFRAPSRRLPAVS